MTVGRTDRTSTAQSAREEVVCRLEIRVSANEKAPRVKGPFHYPGLIGQVGKLIRERRTSKVSDLNLSGQA